VADAASLDLDSNRSCTWHRHRPLHDFPRAVGSSDLHDTHRSHRILPLAAQPLRTKRNGGTYGANALSDALFAVCSAASLPQGTESKSSCLEGVSQVNAVRQTMDWAGSWLRLRGAGCDRPKRTDYRRAFGSNRMRRCSRRGSAEPQPFDPTAAVPWRARALG